MVATNGVDLDARLTVKVPDLLAFFDEKTRGSERHASSIVAVCGEDLGCGLLKHYLEQQRAQVQILRRPRTSVPLPCTQGTQAGSRLDRWVRVTNGPSPLEPDVLFQVEVKNWSAHAIGGERLPLDASPEAIAKYKRSSWAKQWDDGTGIKAKSLRKLLEPMQPPLAHLPIEPLACMWVCLHPEGKSECLFSVKLPQGQRDKFSFNRVWFFSMSAYLRSVACEDVVIEMPDTAKRLQWLSKLAHECGGCQAVERFARWQGQAPAQRIEV